MFSACTTIIPEQLCLFLNSEHLKTVWFLFPGIRWISPFKWFHGSRGQAVRTLRILRILKAGKINVMMENLVIPGDNYIQKVSESMVKITLGLGIGTSGSREKETSQEGSLFRAVSCLFSHVQCQWQKISSDSLILEYIEIISIRKASKVRATEGRS